MIEDNFYYSLYQKLRGKDYDGANDVVMNELGGAISEDKGGFVQVLRESGIDVGENEELESLVNKFVANAPYNDKLLLGTSIYLSHKNKKSSADGISDTGVKATYKVMYEYFDGCAEEPKSNWVGAIAKAVGEGANLGSKIVEGRNQKKYGASIQAGKQQEARSKLLDSIMAKKQSEADEKAKQAERKGKIIKIAVVSGVLLTLLLVGGAIYLKSKGKKL